MGRHDYIVDIAGLQPGRAGRRTDSDGKLLRDRPWLAIHWQCCRKYSRIYRNAEGTAYVGQCPKCGRTARATVGPGGVSARFFKAK